MPSIDLMFFYKTSDSPKVSASPKVLPSAGSMLFIFPAAAIGDELKNPDDKPITPIVDCVARIRTDQKFYVEVFKPYGEKGAERQASRILPIYPGQDNDFEMKKGEHIRLRQRVENAERMQGHSATA